MGHRWRSSETIQKVSRPVLFLSGEKDELVPPRMMKLLHDVCSSPEKIWKSFPDGEHMDTYSRRGYYPTLQKFIADFVGNPSDICSQ